MLLPSNFRLPIIILPPLHPPTIARVPSSIRPAILIEPRYSVSPHHDLRTRPPALVPDVNPNIRKRLPPRHHHVARHLHASSARHRDSVLSRVHQHVIPRHLVTPARIAQHDP